MLKQFEHHTKSFVKLNDIQRKALNDYKNHVKSGNYIHEKISCINCDDENFDIILNNDRYGIDCKLVICNSCGLLHTNPRLDERSYNKFYNNIYRRLYTGSEIATSSFFHKQYLKGKLLYEYMKPHLDINKNEEKLVVEIGCGAGGILKYFKEMGFKTIGYDLNEKYIKFGKDMHGLDLNKGSIDSLNNRAKPYLIIYADVLEHVVDINKELTKIHSTLGENGMLYIGLPGIKNLHFSYKMDIQKLHQNAHVYIFSLKTITNLLMKHNFDIFCGNEKINAIFKKTRLVNKYSQYDLNESKKIKRYIACVNILNRLFIRLDLLRDYYLSFSEITQSIIRRIYSLIKK